LEHSIVLERVLRSWRSPRIEGQAWGS
jgi:hypothetical protein